MQTGINLCVNKSPWIAHCFSHFSSLSLCPLPTNLLCLPVVFQVACMQLINALVTSPDELDLRLHIRNEFMRCGLKEIFPVSKTHGSALMHTFAQNGLIFSLIIYFSNEGSMLLI